MEPGNAANPAFRIAAVRNAKIQYLAPGLAAGLYLSRVLAESGPGPCPLWLALALIGLGLGAGVALAALLRRLALTAWPLGLLLVYVVWPQPWGSLAWSLLLLTSVMLVMLRGAPSPGAGSAPDSGQGQPPQHVPGLSWRSQAIQVAGAEGLVFLAALALYIGTLAPGVLPADSGEFQLVAAVLGIAHPPGYPLYTLLGKLFTLLPVGDMAYRVNLLSAVCGAATLAVIARSVRRATGSSAAALLAAGMLGLSATFWVQSTTANIRSLTALLTALCLVTLWRWGQTQTTRYLLAFAVCFGLGVGHHASIALLGLPYLAYILARAPRLLLQPRRWAGPLAAFLASFAILLYLPWRSLQNPAFDPAPIRSWEGFLSHVLALGFRGDFLYFRSPAELLARLGIWLTILRLEFGVVPLLATLAALYPVARLRGAPDTRLRPTWPELLLWPGVVFVNTLSALTYRAPQTVEYLIPSYVALALLLGYGLGWGLRAWQGTAGRGAPARIPNGGVWGTDARIPGWAMRYWGVWGTDAAIRNATCAGLVAALALAVAWQARANYPSLQIAARGSLCLGAGHDTSARAYAQPILQEAPPQTLILANWHYATVFWYLQQVEGLRPDVEVRYVYPEGALPNEQVWLRQIGADVGRRPVVVTNRFYAYEQTRYRWVAFHQAWLVQEPEQPLTTPAQLVSRAAAFEEGIHLLGYVLEQDTLAPGDAVSLRVYWQPTARLPRDYSTFVQLLGPDGVVGQGDIAQNTRAYLPGEVRVDAYRFPLLLHTPPGAYQLVTGFYYAEGGGWTRLKTADSDHLLLATLQVQAARSPAATLHPQEAHYAQGLRLTGVDYDRSVPGQMRLYLHWQQTPTYGAPTGSAAETAALPARACLASGPAPSPAECVAQATLPALLPGQAATLALDLPADLPEVWLSLADAAGRPVARLGPWHLAGSTTLKLTLPQGDVHYLPLGGAMVFTGFQRLPAAVGRGETLWLRPRFLALQPLWVDYTVSVGLRRGEPAWEQKTDGTPALGAIPTLKWLRGWLVPDAHPLQVAAAAPAGPANLTLTVYDAFTLEPLRVLDERLVRQGRGTHVELAGPMIR